VISRDLIFIALYCAPQYTYVSHHSAQLLHRSWSSCRSNFYFNFQVLLNDSDDIVKLRTPNNLL